MTFSTSDQQRWVRAAMAEAELSVAAGDGPFGVVLVDAEGKLIGQAHNTQNSDRDESAHAAINLLRLMGRRKQPGCAVFMNAASCSMCASALIKAGVRDFFYGAASEGGMQPNLPLDEIARYCADEIRVTGGILNDECRAQIERGRQAQVGK